MINGNLLENFISRRTGNSVPDGRPLYAYKCRSNDYIIIRSFVSETIRMELEGQGHPIFRPLFCLYAAETWRQRHAGGYWEWQTVFSDICDIVPEHHYIRKWVADGLNYWKRPVLQTKLGYNQYLVTIACEGGLPLLLLRNENARLYRYFKSLLDCYHAQRNSPYVDAVAIARQMSMVLSPSLRHDIVFNLGGKLIEKIIVLQDEVADAVDPINALDLRVKNWRDMLPLPIEDDTVELLIKNLVQEARSLSITERQRVLWRRRLLCTDGDYTVEKQLEVPKRFVGRSLLAWTGRSEIPPRMRLILQSEKASEPVALITRLRGEGEAAIYGCEILKRGGIRVRGKQALVRSQLFLSDGKTEHPLSTRGEEDWGPLPWVFGERNGQWEYLGEGSVRCKDDSVYALVPKDGFIKSEQGSTNPVSELPDLNRILYQASGTFVWQHPELGFCRIRCQTQDAEDVTYLMEGKRFKKTSEMEPPYAGLPNLISINQSNNSRIEGQAFLEWCRNIVGDKNWRRDTSGCKGNVWLRWSNQEGEQILCRKARVMPSDSAAEIAHVGHGPSPGKLLFKALPGVSAYIPEINGCSFEQGTFDDDIEISCFTEKGISVTQFPVSLYWPDGCQIQIQLPLPREGAAFTYKDEVFPPGIRVPVAKLATMQAIAQAPSPVRKFDLRIKVQTENHLLRNLTIKEGLSVDENGRSIFNLHQIQERISSILALTGELNSYAILEVVDPAERSMARVEVGQFDLEWRADWDEQQIHLPEGFEDRLEGGWEERLSARMVPLSEPAEEPQILRKGGEPTQWVIPEGLAAGPWWVLGEDGDWARFRPMLWPIPGETPATDSLLRNVILTEDPEERAVLLEKWVEEIDTSPDHPDWPLFFDYLELIRPYPACSLDLFCYIIKSPRAMIMALLKSTDENFNAVWTLSDQLPFSWYLSPVKAWLVSAKNYFNAMQNALSELENGDDLLWQSFLSFREKLTVRRPYFRQICDWICPVVFPGKVLENSELALAQSAPEFFAQLIRAEEEAFQGRHDSNELFPDGPQTMRWTECETYPSAYAYSGMAEHYRPVRCAPFVAAHISLYGGDYDEELLFEIRRIRAFDRDWFKAAFAYALCLGLSQMDPTVILDE